MSSRSTFACGGGADDGAQECPRCSRRRAWLLVLDLGRMSRALRMAGSREELMGSPLDTSFLCVLLLSC